MDAPAVRTVYPCEEFGEVAVPIRELFHDGELKVYPEVSGRGLFDIDYGRGLLVLKASRYVGLIPISDRVAIHVRPRITIANLLYLLWKSGGALRRLSGFARSYDVPPERVDSPEGLYLDTLLASMRRIRETGLLKRYRRRESTEMVRGRLLISRSISQSYSKGYRNRPTFEVHEFGANCPENQILKATAERLLRHCRSNPTEQFAAAGRELAMLLTDYSSVDSTGVNAQFVAKTVPALIRALPGRFHNYEAPLWLSLLLALGAVVSLETTGGARFETLVLDVSQVFERYVRRLCQDSDDPTLRAYKFIDGNQRPVELFVSGVRSPTEPDIYVLRGRDPVAVLDAKYKPKPSREDRYELLAFCEALGVKRAAFICPEPGDGPVSESYGTTKSGIVIRTLRIRLHSPDREAAEAEFLSALREFVADVPSTVASA